MKKATIILSCLLLISLLMGCEKKEIGTAYISLRSLFVTSEIVVEVTRETKSFRIELECPPEHPDSSYTLIPAQAFIDKIGTTAKHEVHFVNTPSEAGAIGKFETVLNERKSYKDVTIIPKNITEQVVIIYSTLRYRPDGCPIEQEGLFNQLTVILKPKPSK